MRGRCGETERKHEKPSCRFADSKEARTVPVSWWAARPQGAAGLAGEVTDRELVALISPQTDLAFAVSHRAHRAKQTMTRNATICTWTHNATVLQHKNSCSRVESETDRTPVIRIVRPVANLTHPRMHPRPPSPVHGPALASSPELDVPAPVRDRSCANFASGHSRCQTLVTQHVGESQVCSDTAPQGYKVPNCQGDRTATSCLRPSCPSHREQRNARRT